MRAPREPNFATSKGDPDDEPPVHYEVQITDVAEAEASEAYLWFSQHRSPDYAACWYNGLLSAIESLAENPRRWSMARESYRYEGEVRRLTYRHGSVVYRALFRVIEPAEPGAEGVVRVLHIYHGAQNTDPEQLSSE
jgi:plasmid stabilization system protein ParE